MSITDDDLPAPLPGETIDGYRRRATAGLGSAVLKPRTRFSADLKTMLGMFTAVAVAAWVIGQAYSSIVESIKVLGARLDGTVKDMVTRDDMKSMRSEITRDVWVRLNSKDVIVQCPKGVLRGDFVVPCQVVGSVDGIGR